MDAVERARRGDIGAYEELVRQHQDLAFRTAFVITGDAAEAEDAAQEAFVKAYYALARFRSGMPFRPWLLRIVANEARNRRKAARRRTGLALRAAQEPSPAENVLSPEATVLAAERRGSLLAALRELKLEDRLVIAYRYLFDLSEAETAQVLDCPRGTVKSRLSRSLDRLRKQLADTPVNPAGTSGGPADG